MSDNLESDYAVRRPLLTQVAESIREELHDRLSKLDIAAKLHVGTLSAVEFVAAVAKSAPVPFDDPLVELPSQIQARIETVSADDIMSIEAALTDDMQILDAEWLTPTTDVTGARLLVSSIPDYAQPDGWSSRADVPKTFEMKIMSVPGINLSPPQMQIAKIDRALVMKGGGIKGLAYVGALEHLTASYTFNWYIGTSAGAITAVLLAAGFSVAELKEILSQQDFRKFLDAPWYNYPTNLWFYHGLHRTDALTAWLDNLLATKLKSPTRVKLVDLPHRITIYACRKGTRALAFDSHDPRTSDDYATHAVACSMSIPYVFMPQSDQGVWAFDGGLKYNYPVDELLRTNPAAPFLGMYLGPRIYEATRQRFVFWEVFLNWTESTDAESLEKYQEQTIIIDPRPIGTLDFALTETEKAFLLSCGSYAALSHLDDASQKCQVAREAYEGLKRQVEAARKAQSTKKKRCRRIVCGVLIVAALIWWWWPESNAPVDAQTLEPVIGSSTDNNRMPRPSLIFKPDDFSKQRSICNNEVLEITIQDASPTFKITPSHPKLGTLVKADNGNPMSFRYQAPQKDTGTDTITFKLSDGKKELEDLVLSFEVIPRAAAEVIQN